MPRWRPFWCVELVLDVVCRMGGRDPGRAGEVTGPHRLWVGGGLAASVQ